MERGKETNRSKDGKLMQQSGHRGRAQRQTGHFRGEQSLTLHRTDSGPGHVGWQCNPVRLMQAKRIKRQ